MDSVSYLMWAMLFGAIGLGYLTYGRRQHAGIPLLAGFGLMVIPWFISNVYALVAVGIIFMALPFFIRS